MHVTVCPPAAPRPDSGFDKAQFAGRHAYPVEAHYVGSNAGINGWASSGLSFADYGRMGTEKHKQKHARRLPTPDYMYDEKAFRSVMLRYLEVRCFGRYKKIEGTEVERAHRIAERSKIRVEMELNLLDAYSHEYVALRCSADPASSERLRWLENQINCCDTRIRVLKEPWVLPTICRLYYFEGLNSVDVAARTGLTKYGVRQILYRISKLAGKMDRPAAAQKAACSESGRVQVAVPPSSSEQLYVLQQHAS